MMGKMENRGSCHNNKEEKRTWNFLLVGFWSVDYYLVRDSKPRLAILYEIERN